MSYIKPIFEKATIKVIVDYLLYGLAPDEDTRDYEARLEEVFEKYKKAVLQFDDSPTSELLDLANDVTGETASVYMEIGIQVGILLMKDMMKNIKTETLDKADVAGDKGGIIEFINDVKKLSSGESVLNDMYKAREEGGIEDVLKRDEKYQEINKKAYDKVQKIDKINFSTEQWKMIDEALSVSNERNSEYGRVAYYQGFKDAVNLISEIKQFL